MRTRTEPPPTCLGIARDLQIELEGSPAVLGDKSLKVLRVDMAKWGTDECLSMCVQLANTLTPANSHFAFMSDRRHPTSMAALLTLRLKATTPRGLARL